VHVIYEFCKATFVCLLVKVIDFIAIYFVMRKGAVVSLYRIMLCKHEYKL